MWGLAHYGDPTKFEWEIQTSLTRLQPHAGCLRTSTPLAQTIFFRAATGKAFTIVFAGFALTIISLPETSLFPALVAGFRRALIITTPGMVNLPFLTSLAATSTRLSKTFLQSDFFTALFVSKAAKSSVLLIDAAPFMAFIAFIAGAICVKRYWDQFS